MGTKNFLFWLKEFKQKIAWALQALIVTSLCWALMGCQSGLFKRPPAPGEPQVGEPVSPGASGPMGPEDGSVPPADQAEALEGSFVNRQAPSLGVILGGGGVLTYAHIGVLQELVRQKIPVKAIVGMEWGALIAGLYSANGKVHEVEWQMLKLPAATFGSTSMFGSKKEITPDSFNGFLKKVFQDKKISAAKVPFACPYLDVGKSKSAMAQRGRLRDVMKLCWPSMPQFQLSRQMANPMAYKEAASFLRNQGADLILLVDVAGPNKILPAKGVDLASRLYWLQVQSSADDHPNGVINEVFSIPVSGVHASEYGAMRSVIRVGQLKSRSLIQRFAKKYGY